MRLDEFMEKVRREVEAKTGGTAKIDGLNRINGVERHGLTVFRPGCNVSPTVDLDGYYEQLGTGRKLEEVLEEIVRIYSDSRTMRPVDVSDFYDWDKVKAHIVYRLVNRGENRALLEKVPYAEVLDMAKVYSIIRKSDGHGMMAEVQVTLDMMESWAIDRMELERLAGENTPRELPVSVRVLKNLSGMPGERKELPELYLISNDTGCMGAGAIFYEGFMEALAAQLGGNLYLLAFSINEAVALRKQEQVDIMGVRDVLLGIYGNLPKEEFLSDGVYCYESEKKQIVKLGDTVGSG